MPKADLGSERGTLRGGHRQAVGQLLGSGGSLIMVVSTSKGADRVLSWSQVSCGIQVLLMNLSPMHAWEPCEYAVLIQEVWGWGSGSLHS